MANEEINKASFREVLNNDRKMVSFSLPTFKVLLDETDFGARLAGAGMNIGVGAGDLQELNKRFELWKETNLYSINSGTADLTDMSVHLGIGDLANLRRLLNWSAKVTKNLSGDGVIEADKAQARLNYIDLARREVDIATFRTKWEKQNPNRIYQILMLNRGTNRVG